MVRRLEKGNELPIFAGIFHRFLRLIPTYAFVMGVFWFLVDHLGSGPFWFQIRDKTAQCSRYWWTNLLFINNLYPTVYDQQCMVRRNHITSATRTRIPVFLSLVGSCWPGKTLDSKITHHPLIFEKFSRTPSNFMQPWTWYLANDMQFFILGLLLVSLFQWKPRLGWVVTPTLIVGSMLTTGYIVHSYQVDFLNLSDPGSTFSSWKHGYFFPFAHCPQNDF